MPKRITIDVPDEVADHLANVGNVSAYATEAIRHRLRAEAVRRFLRAEGFTVTAEGVARARARMRAATRDASVA